MVPLGISKCVLNFLLMFNASKLCQYDVVHPSSVIIPGYHPSVADIPGGYSKWVPGPEGTGCCWTGRADKQDKC